MRALVVGYGSIGARHTRLLRALGCTVAVVSRRPIDHAPHYPTLAEALAREQPGYVVIANRTSEHAATLSELLAGGFDGPVLVEKPLFDAPTDISAARSMNVFVAYNLRFHPVIQAVRDFLRNENPVSAHAYAGQYLPLWRPGTDYRDSYSARRQQGGGVLRDLSHELDYLLWLLGNWRGATAAGGHFSSLEIDSDDVFAVMMNTERCPVVTANMNYLDRTGQRRLVINTDKHTLRADLVAGSLDIDGNVRHFETSRDQPYLLQHKAVLENHIADLCTAEEGLEIVRLIDAVERSAGRAWVSNSRHVA